MNTNIESFKINDKARLQRRGENASSFIEISKGYIVGLATGKTDWVKFLQADHTNPDWAEWVPVAAPCVRVVKG